VTELLVDFARLCDSLSAITAEQIKGEELTEEQMDLIRYYGALLGRFHPYEGEAWKRSRDDAPMVVPVCVQTLVYRQFLYAAR